MLTIKLPWPDKKLSPNSRCHYHAKGRAVKQARALACIEAKRQCRKPPRWGEAFYRVRCTLAPKQKTPDEDNLLASLKAYRDGLQDAGIVSNDRGLRIGGTVDFIRGDESSVEFLIWEWEG